MFQPAKSDEFFLKVGTPSGEAVFCLDYSTFLYLIMSRTHDFIFFYQNNFNNSALFLYFRFDLYTQLHLILYPYVLYPLSNISLTASIYMIAAITLERYCAVHYPLDYRQVLNYIQFHVIHVIK